MATLAKRVARAVQIADELRRHGVQIAIDDFGTGFTSLSYLQRQPIDILKIDRAFTHEVDADPDARRLLSGLLRLADALQVTSLAEGVERREQLDERRELRCTLAQGYLLGVPLDADSLRGHLTAAIAG